MTDRKMWNDRTISDIMKKMIEISDGNLHDINHFLKVYAYAKTIAESEGVDADTARIVEAAAILHDIACPLCREKYGCTDGKYQEKEGAPMAEAFLGEMGLPEDFVRRVAWLVGHHHTLDAVDGTDYQILVEADYLVNADESGYSKENIRNVREKIFRTGTGRKLLEDVYGI